MFNAGAARMKIRIEAQTETLDGMGAPKQTWALYKEVNAAAERTEFNVSDSLTTGPRREATKTMTLVIRNHIGFAFATSMRVVDVRTSEIFSITAIRYSSLLDICYLDVVGGVSRGN